MAKTDNWVFPPDYRLVPAPYIKARLAKAGEICRGRGLAGLLLTQPTDVYYLSGTIQQGAVVVDPAGDARLFLRRHVGRGQAESPLEAVAVTGFDQVAQALSPVLGQGARLGLTLDVMPAQEYLSWQKRLPYVELVDASRSWLNLKGVKDGFELEALAQAGRLAVELFEEIPRILKPGITEIQAAGQIQALALAKGHAGIARSRPYNMDDFAWMVVSGPEGAWPSALDAPYAGMGLSPAFSMGPGRKKLKPHEPIIVDLGICWQGYQTDQTRTFCLGEAPKQVKDAHQCLKAVEAAITENLRPGAVSGKIYDIAVATAERHGMGRVFLGNGSQRIRFVGHGVGLELGTPPYLLKGSKAKVTAGQAYALELKIVLDQGPVGLENTFAVNESGPPFLLTPIPEELFEIKIP